MVQLECEDNPKDVRPVRVLVAAAAPTCTSASASVSPPSTIVDEFEQLWDSVTTAPMSLSELHQRWSQTVQMKTSQQSDIFRKAATALNQSLICSSMSGGRSGSRSSRSVRSHQHQQPHQHPHRPLPQRLPILSSKVTCCCGRERELGI